MLHFALCDDNVPILDKLNKTLETIFIKHNIDAEISIKATTPDDILNYIDSNTVDVLILDINLKSSISGCDIADIVRKKNKDVYIIFLTGHLEYVLIAYKYKTFDYLPKPISDERLEDTILRLIEDMKNVSTKFIKLNNNIIIKQDDINYIKKNGMKLVFCTSSNDYEIYSSFSKIENLLPSNFIRCHKSYIININNVTEYLTNNNVVNFENNHFCSIGSKYKNNFLEVLKDGNFTRCLDCINN